MHVSVHTCCIHHFEILTLGHSKKLHGTGALLAAISAYISSHYQPTSSAPVQDLHPTSKYLQSAELLTQLGIVGHVAYNLQQYSKV